MSRLSNPLDHVRIAAPCKADWEQMIGTERVRFCGQCNLNVYNLSSMTKLQAESLIAEMEGRLCVRFYRRTDGSILTDNCPVGLRAIRKRLSYFAKAASAAVLSFLAGLGVYRATAVPPNSAIAGRLVLTAPEIEGVKSRMESDTIPPSAVEVGQGQGQAFISHAPYPDERKATRRRGRSRTGPTR